MAIHDEDSIPHIYHPWHLWRKMMTDVDRNLPCFIVNSVLLRFTLFCRKLGFVAIYALLRGEKIEPKIVYVEKK